MGTNPAPLTPPAADMQHTAANSLPQLLGGAADAAATDASSGTEQGIKLNTGIGSLAGFNEGMPDNGKVAQRSPELAEGFSKSSRLKQAPAVVNEAPTGSVGSSAASSSVGAAAASPEGVTRSADLHSPVMHEEAASVLAAGFDTGIGSQAGSSDKVEDGLAVGRLPFVAPHSAASSSASSKQGGSKHAVDVLRMPGLKQTDAVLPGAEEPAAAKQAATAKQKGSELPMAKDTPDMRAQFVKQLLISAFDMDRHW